jgi:hypothetical protein
VDAYVLYKIEEERERLHDEAKLAAATLDYAEGKAMCNCSNTMAEWADILYQNIGKGYIDLQFKPFVDDHLPSCAVWTKFKRPFMAYGIMPRRRLPTDKWLQIPVPTACSYLFRMPVIDRPEEYPVRIDE